MNNKTRLCCGSLLLCVLLLLPVGSIAAYVSEDSESIYSTVKGKLTSLKANLEQLEQLSKKQKLLLSTLGKALTASEQSVIRLSNNLVSLGNRSVDLSLELNRATTSLEQASQSSMKLLKSLNTWKGFGFISGGAAVVLLVVVVIQSLL